METVTLINFQCGKIDFNQVPVTKNGLNMFKVRLSFLISNILCKIVVNDLLNNQNILKDIFEDKRGQRRENVKIRSEFFES